ncbi:MAG: indolepyruvate oxidoreductase subunit beta [archaeon]
MDGKKDIIIAGVGGQGILTMAKIIVGAAFAEELKLKQPEVHGMSQRGGAVYTHVRLSPDYVNSDIIPAGAADLIIGVEPMEALRYADALAPDGMIVSSSVPVENISDYDVGGVLGFLDSLDNVVLIDSNQVAIAAKNKQGQNIAVLGVSLPYLGIEREVIEGVMEDIFGDKGPDVVAANLRALQMGEEAGAVYRR